MASANQVLVEANLKVNADTSQAKKAIQDLQNSLTNISAGKGVNFNFSGFAEASQAAQRLSGYLKNAVDVDTGKLNLNKFALSLKNGGDSLERLKSQLISIGPEGSAAFNKLSTAITTASTSSIQLSKRFTNLANTMMNVVKYQMSTAIYREISGAISSAVSYAQELDESLNNIQIVTGASNAEMAEFAAQANKAAQALSTTTTKYTDAALIFYQQGLSGNDVTERTDAVIKMANVTKDSVTEVSSYMTAIWNNFDDGTETLEHYEDVITALGASTASSSSEIAAGLEKFASIAQTVGLSYDYATSALATVVANTRQSADTVGTA